MAFGRPAINKCNVVRHEEIHSVPSCIACGIIMLKKSDIGIILKPWDNVPGKNFISVALGIQIPFDNDEISAKPCAMPAQTKTELRLPERSRSSRQRQHNVHFYSGILEPCHHLDEW